MRYLVLYTVLLEKDKMSTFRFETQMEFYIQWNIFYCILFYSKWRPRCLLRSQDELLNGARQDRT